jgi:hypothetical protein
MAPVCSCLACSVQRQASQALVQLVMNVWLTIAAAAALSPDGLPVCKPLLGVQICWLTLWWASVAMTSARSVHNGLYIFNTHGLCLLSHSQRSAGGGSKLSC